jgi:hypothetical protein
MHNRSLTCPASFCVGAILAAGVASTAAHLGAGTPGQASGDGLLSAAGAAVAALPGAVEEVNREVLLPGLEAVAGDIHTLAKGAEQQVSVVFEVALWLKVVVLLAVVYDVLLGGWLHPVNVICQVYQCIV